MRGKEKAGELKLLFQQINLFSTRFLFDDGPRFRISHPAALRDLVIKKAGVIYESLRLLKKLA